MKSVTKRIATVGLVSAYALTMFSGLRVFDLKKADAATGASVASSTYFRDSLAYTDANGKEQEFVFAKKFYDAIGKMHAEGDFKDGVVEYSLTANNLATGEMIRKWVEDGDLTIPKAFSAARDAYLTDHPELFYIDFYKMTISAARTNGEYTAYIDSGREANLYHDAGFKSATEVDAAITAYESKVNEIAQAATAEANKDTYGTAKAVLLARYVNAWFANTDNVTYDFGAYDEYLANGSSGSSAASINTAYGSLIVGKAVCGGFARGYKSVMDKLNIPCLVVSGYGNSRDGKNDVTERMVSHAWNYVYLPAPAKGGVVATKASAKEDGAWYAVDSTWNNTGSDKNKYMNMGSLSLTRDHVVDGVISSSGYELKYPEIAVYNYGCSTNSNGLTYSVEYVPYTDELDDNGNPLVSVKETVSYNGKSAVRLLEEDNLYLVFRYGYMDEGGEVTWTLWYSYGVMLKYGYMTLTDEVDDGHSSVFFGNTLMLYSQYAIIDTEPDLDYNPDVADSKPGDSKHKYFYSRSDQTSEHITAISAVNENLSFGTYVASPYVQKTTPYHGQFQTISDGMKDPDSTKVIMADKNAFEISVKYDEELHILDESKPIGIFYVSEHANTKEYTKFVPFEDGSLVQLRDKDTLVFKFCPSLMYEHNGEMYSFTFTNVGSNKTQYGKGGTPYVSNKLPNPVHFDFARSSMACPNIFGDGRLWIDCCAQPTLISNSDLSEVNFQDEDGNYFSESQRSQMMLVVDSPNTAETETMQNLLNESSDINVNMNDVMKSETYEISLSMCGKVAKVPNGSYVKIALGFPEGYGPDDEGVTFKLYHYKRNNKNEIVAVEEYPCVVTQFGIVATVESFSPFMVAVVPADKATEKTVFASVVGKGGKLNNADGKIRSLKEGESYTYTITPEEGYGLYRVTLNGTDVTARVSEGKLTLTYDELDADNEVEMQFISDAAAARFAEKGIVEPVKVVVPVGGVEYVDPYLPSGGGNTALVVGISVGVTVVVIAAAVVIAVFMIKRKNKGAKKNA